MVRILTCHHFGGQKIGKCEEAHSLSVAGDWIVVGLEHQVNVYAAEPHKELCGSKICVTEAWNGTTRDGGEIGTGPITFQRGGGGPFGGSSKVTSPVSLMSPGVTRKDVTEALMSEGQMKLSHSFPTVDLIDSISYNRRGHYLLCLEARDQFGSGSASLTGSMSSSTASTRGFLKTIRVYFNWDNENQARPMRARIAGLVSPGEPEEDSLGMVELPQPAPIPGVMAAGQQVVAVASCQVMGHVAALTDGGNVHLYTFKVKDSKQGRGGQYSDFDFTYTIEAGGLNNDGQLRVSFAANVLAVSNRTKAAVFRISKSSRLRGRSLSNASSVSSSVSSKASAKSPMTPMGGRPVLAVADEVCNHKICEKVVYDPKNEAVKVHVNLVERTNEKRKFPEMGPGYSEEFQEEIGLMNKCRLIYSKGGDGVTLEDLLRVTVGTEVGGNANESLAQVDVYPIRVREDLGGICCVVGTCSQAFVYHISGKAGDMVSRVVTYPLTAPLVSFTFDGLFFHALTETGLETYTCRHLYYALRDVEGFERYKNDCLFQYETPSLVGIRPFIGVRHMRANESTLCLLSSPAGGGPSAGDESSWTIYALRLPTVEMLYEDISKAAMTAKLNNPDTYITLTSELHLILRSYINANPSLESQYVQRYRATCKSMGIEDCKRASGMIDEALGMNDGPEKYKKELAGQEMLDRGVTFLNMSGMDLKTMFDEENNMYVKDKKMQRGITRFINVKIEEWVDSPNKALPPKLAGALTDFLVGSSMEALVRIVVNVPVMRESNSAKMLEILKKHAEEKGYTRDITTALLLTIVSIGGCEKPTRAQVKEILSQNQSKSLESIFRIGWLLDLSVANRAKLTDLTVCMSTAGSSVPEKVICESLASAEIRLNDVLAAFSQGISLNSEADIQKALTKTLTQVIEGVFVGKLIRYEKQQDAISIYETSKKVNGHRESLMNGHAPEMTLNEDEKLALKSLLRNYLAHVTVKPSAGYSSGRRSRPSSGGSIDRVRVNSYSGARPGSPRSVSPAGSDNEEKYRPDSNINEITETSLSVFGRVPAFLAHILKDGDHPVGSASTYQMVMNLPGASDDTKESFMKLCSLLASPLGALSETLDTVKNFLDTKGQSGQVLHTCLQLLSDSTEQVITTLIAKYPLAIMYYAKEMLGKSPVKWKMLVQKLKEKIYANADDVDIFSTIIESVYLHLANTLSPTELEQVLDKAEESSKYFKACRRTELANTYTNMVMQLSNEYLQS